MSANQLHNEVELLLRVSEGDERAFAELFAFYYPRIYTLVYRFSLNDEDVREALQETFLTIWLQREQLTDINNLDGWLLRIASRKCRALLRKNLLSRRTDGKAAQVANDTHAGDPAETLQVAEVGRLISLVVRDMPEQRRLIFTLSRQEGLKPSEIAARLNLSVSTVKNTLVTALRQIRQSLSEAGYHLPLIFLLFF